MKKLIALFSSLAVFITLNAQSVFDDFESFTDDADLKTEWTGFGLALNGEIYLSPAGGTSATQAAIYVGNWNYDTDNNSVNDTFFGAQNPQGGADFSGSTTITVDARAITNTHFNEPATQNTVFRIGIEGQNGDIWESNVNQSITSTTFSTFTFSISEAEMTKTTNATGTGLANALASVTDFRFLFDNTGSGVQDILLDNFTVTGVPEPSTYALLVGILVFGLVGIKRNIR